MTPGQRCFKHHLRLRNGIQQIWMYGVMIAMSRYWRQGRELESSFNGQWCRFQLHWRWLPLPSSMIPGIIACISWTHLIVLLFSLPVLMLLSSCIIRDGLNVPTCPRFPSLTWGRADGEELPGWKVRH
ncbi:hypothetical protein CPB84DRAFT_1543626 [Gymnopilus junonius]|uniref:Uncharacterized protein n=1 Tax=Gymnopilus junonius TaxID=109634 RepID=A0A9P5NEX5_GYMJU|nr:hypothetical protein CPB84DRAFT_1543626 [Gymnopilus junonius]